VELDHSDAPLGFVVSEGDDAVCGEAQHVVLIRSESTQQSPRLGMGDADTGLEVQLNRRLSISCPKILLMCLPDCVEGVE